MRLLMMATLGLCCSVSVFAEENCRSRISDTLISSNLVVSQNCSIERSQVKGNIIIKPQAQLTMTNTTISGHVEANSGFQTLYATNNVIQGNVQLTNGQSIHLVGNRINGDIDVSRVNEKIFIQNNHVGDDLNCENNSASIKGGQNYVKGDKEGQCRGL